MNNKIEIQDKYYSPFILQGIEVYTPEDLVKLCEVPSINASEYLMRGDFENWYEWQAYSENINIVDLPGLGDSPKNDNIFQNIYR